MKKAILTVFIIALIAAGAGAAVYFLVLKKPGTASAEKVFVQSVEALQSYGGYGSRYGGIVESQKTEKTEFDPERRLKELFVAVEDHVEEGDPLFSYDTESISLEIDQINLEIERLKTDISNNTNQITELSKDLEKLSDSDRLEYSAQIAELQADIAQAEYDVKTKQSDIKKKEASIENATVFAKMGGTVISIADVNDIIAGVNLDESNEVSNVFIIVQADGNFRIKGRISETNIFDLYPGQRLIVRSRIDDSVTWGGTVELIDTQNTSQEQQNLYYESGSNSASKYDFYVELDSTEGLMIGQHVILEPDQESDVTSEGIWLDGGWIVTAEDGTQTVWAAASDGAKLESREIKTGRHLEETDQYEILSGLSLSDYVAWPDDSCVEGAPTTSEYIVPEEEPNEPQTARDGETVVYEEEVNYEDGEAYEE